MYAFSELCKERTNKVCSDPIQRVFDSDGMEFSCWFLINPLVFTACLDIGVDEIGHVAIYVHGVGVGESISFFDSAPAIVRHVFCLGRESYQ